MSLTEEKLKSISSSLILFLIVFSVVNLHSNFVTSIIGRASLFLVVLLTSIYLFSYLISRKIDKDLIPISRAILLIFSINLISVVFSQINMQSGATRLIQLASIFGTALFFFTIGKNGKAELTINTCANYLTPTATTLAILLVASEKNDQPLGFLNSNSIGLFGVTLFFLIASRFTAKKTKATIFAATLFAPLLIAYMSASRTSMLSIGAGLMLFLFWPYLSKSKQLFTASMIAILSACGMIIVTLGTKSETLIPINSLIFDITGKNILSGRDLIWPLTIDLISEHVFFGWGAGVLLSDITPFEISTHNIFLQTMLQTGVIGLIALVLLIFTVWSAILESKNSKYSRACASYFIGVLVVQNFEITLTQNNLVFSLPFWAILGLCIGDARHHQNNILNKAKNKECK